MKIELLLRTKCIYPRNIRQFYCYLMTLNRTRQWHLISSRRTIYTILTHRISSNYPSIYPKINFLNYFKI